MHQTVRNNSYISIDHQRNVSILNDSAKYYIKYFLSLYSRLKQNWNPNQNISDFSLYVSLYNLILSCIRCNSHLTIMVEILTANRYLTYGRLYIVDNV